MDMRAVILIRFIDDLLDERLGIICFNGIQRPSESPSKCKRQVKPNRLRCLGFVGEKTGTGKGGSKIGVAPFDFLFT